MLILLHKYASTREAGPLINADRALVKWEDKEPEMPGSKLLLREGQASIHKSQT
jgi:hypothetical protein